MALATLLSGGSRGFNKAIPASNVAVKLRSAAIPRHLLALSKWRRTLGVPFNDLFDLSPHLKKNKHYSAIK